jgi:sec-independent protein translocase protein TatA
MPTIGPIELIIVLVVALLILGPRRLPAAGRSLGQGLKKFKGRHHRPYGSSRRTPRRPQRRQTAHGGLATQHDGLSRRRESPLHRRANASRRDATAARYPQVKPRRAQQDAPHQSEKLVDGRLST